MDEQTEKAFLFILAELKTMQVALSVVLEAHADKSGAMATIAKRMAFIKENFLKDCAPFSDKTQAMLERHFDEWFENWLLALSKEAPKTA